MNARQHFFKTFAATAVASLFALTAQATEFRSSDVHPDDYPTVQAVRYMGELLNKSTNGKHSIKVFSKSALGNEKDTIEQTKLGAIAMTRVNVAPMNNICAAVFVPLDRSHAQSVGRCDW
jgi:TRAP-type C4-dicarboxylate transport system substrate-binding protein